MLISKFSNFETRKKPKKVAPAVYKVYSRAEFDVCVLPISFHNILKI